METDKKTSLKPGTAWVTSPEIQEAYQAYDRQVRLTNLRVWSFLAFLLVPAGSTLDYFVYPDFFREFLAARLWCSALVAVIYGLTYTALGRRFYGFLSLLLPLLPTLLISWMILVTDGVHSTYYAGLNLVLLAVGLIFPWTYRENLFVGALVMGIYLAACMAHGDVHFSGILFNNLFFLVTTDVIVVTASYFRSRLRFREFALRWELDQNRRSLEAANRRLTELNRVRTRFFANISHELRTPLTLVLTPVETLRSSPDFPSFPPAVQEVLETAYSQGLRLLKLINNLLDLVRLESGRVEARREAVDAGSFLRGIASSLLRMAQGRRVEWVSDLPEDLGMLALDADKVEKVVLNLLTNALKFTRAGGRVEFSARREGGDLVLRVSDTGIGISPDQIPFLFDPFWQADNSTVRRSQGTGIGLSLVKEFTEVMGGRVNVESEPGRGTTFTVRVPAPEVSPGTDTGIPRGGEQDPLRELHRRAQTSEALSLLEASAAREDPAPFGDRPRVLVADDEPDLRRFLTSQLSSDFNVLEAADGREALDKARQYLPSLVLLDFMMPELDGLEVCRMLRAHTATARIPVVLLTAWADDSTKLQALSAGADDFLAKPFSTAELHLRVRNLLRARRLGEELIEKNRRLEAALEQIKENEAQLVQAEKMAALGRLSAGLVHEINNPLNFAGSALQLLQRREGSVPEGERDSYREILGDLEEGLRRVQQIIRDLMDFTHRHADRLEPVDLRGALETAARFLRHEFKNGIQFDLEVPPGEVIEGRKGKLIQVFMNLLQNSLDAVAVKSYNGEKPHVKVAARRSGSMVHVIFQDNGCGIPAENLPKIFEPFFTTKEVGRGMGLGLSLSYGIVKEHGGRMDVESEPGRSTTITLSLPAGRNP